jgi:hypothetical protein
MKEGTLKPSSSHNVFPTDAPTSQPLMALSATNQGNRNTPVTVI